uniref:FERM domain-containing protein n=1 Tax=Echinostoma caproni TaxID=27848 RepID=A0A183AK42_9TREM
LRRLPFPSTFQILLPRGKSEEALHAQASQSTDGTRHYQDTQQAKASLRPPCSALWHSSASSSLNGEHTSTPDCQILEEPIVYFRLRFYVPIHCLRDRSTQHAYYCQLRTNVQIYELFCPVDLYVELAALALQADLGNAPPLCALALQQGHETLPVYFDLSAYFPAKILVEVDLPTLVRSTLIRHVALNGMTSHVAEFWYIRIASKKGSNFNMHLYSLPRLQQPRFAVWLGVTPDGLLIHQQEADGWIRPTVPIRWKEIERIAHKASKLSSHSKK